MATGSSAMAMHGQWVNAVVDGSERDGAVVGDPLGQVVSGDVLAA
jgi:hypothetical protein